MTGSAPGRLIGVGTGPGDPDLLTRKAVRVIETAPVVAFFAKAGRTGHARRIVDGLIPAGTILLPLGYPVTTELPRHDTAYRAQIAAFYDAASAGIAVHLDAGRDVAVLSEGDPLFYGSYMHVHVRLAPRYPTEIVPGVTGMSGCWSQAGHPIAQGDDVLSVLPGTLAEAELARRLADCDAAVIMKLGSNLPKVRRALAASGQIARAIYVERGTMAEGRVQRLADKPDDDAPYFAMVLLPGWRRAA